jgi:hypothetical protein
MKMGKKRNSQHKAKDAILPANMLNLLRSIGVIGLIERIAYRLIVINGIIIIFFWVTFGGTFAQSLACIPFFISITLPALILIEVIGASVKSLHDR